jgi:hypothetical protein
VPRVNWDWGGGREGMRTNVLVGWGDILNAHDGEDTQRVQVGEGYRGLPIATFLCGQAAVSVDTPRARAPARHRA